jgi:hypothetical protein
MRNLLVFLSIFLCNTFSALAQPGFRINARPDSVGKVSDTSLLAQSGITVRIDPRRVSGGNVADYFSEIEYIPLETTKNSLFGVPQWLLITDSSIVIGDRDTWQLLFFDAKGRFIVKYPLPKEAKDFSQRMMIEKNVRTNDIVVTCYPNSTGFGQITTYSGKGRLLKRERHKFQNGEAYTRIYLGSGQYALNLAKYLQPNGKLSQDQIPLIKEYDANNRFVKDLFSLAPADNPFAFTFAGGLSVSQAEDNSGGYFVVPFDYRLYKITKDSISRVGRFIFPDRNVLPAVDFSDYNKYESLAKAKNNDIKLVQTVKNVSCFNKKILFNIQKRVSLIPAGGKIFDPLNFMFDTEKKELMSFERVVPDTLSYYLPIMDGFSSTNGMNLNKGYLYSSMSSLEMFRAYEANKSKNPLYPSVLLDYFSTQTRESNPVIVKMRLKDFKE